MDSTMVESNTPSSLIYLCAITHVLFPVDSLLLFPFEVQSLCP